MKKYIGLLFTAILLAFSANMNADTSDIGHFCDDWGVWYEPDNTNIDNCKVYIKFLFHHKNNDDGWRKKEGGAKIYINGVHFGTFYGEGDKIDPLHWDLENDNINKKLSGWSLPQSTKDFKFTVEQPQFAMHGCSQRHFQYAQMEVTPPATALGTQTSVRIEGRYWRWGDGWADDYPDKTRSVATVYDVDPGLYVIKDVDLNDNCEPFITLDRFNGNSANYAFYYITENGAVRSTRKSVGKNMQRPSYANDTFNYTLSQSCNFSQYKSTAVTLNAYAEAFEGNKALHKKSDESEFNYQGFPYPSNLKVQYDLEDNNVYLSWNKTEIPKYAENGRWYIVRTDQTNNVTATFEVPLDVDNYTDVISENITYSYQVFYHRDNWDKKKLFKNLATDCVQATVTKDVNLQISKTESLDDRVNFLLTFNGSKKDGFYTMAITRDNIPIKNFTDIKAKQSTIEWADIYDAETNPLNFKRAHTYKFTISRTSPYVSTIQSVETTAAASGSTHVENYSATLGVKSQDVLLRWRSVRDYTSLYTDTFRIQRRRCCDTDNDYIIVPGADEIVTTSINNTFTDQNCEAGVMYFYRLQIYHEKQWMDVGKTMGYIISTGAISGRITYADGIGGTSTLACPNADVYITPLKADDSDQQAFPMRCRIVEETDDSIAIPLTNSDLSLLQKAHTLAYWKKDDSTGNKWQHFAYRSNASGVDSLFVSDANGEISQTLEDMSFSDTLSFHGNGTYYDEIQLWSQALTKDDIYTYSLRHLAGEEDGLLAYLPMDESFSYGYCFDQALNGSQSRGHHAMLTPSVSVSNMAAPVLFRTKTDVNGNYSIKGLPFGEEGDNIIYRVTPVYGAHVFSPATQSLLLSTDNRTYTQRDFTDQTSVNVSGVVHYRYGNFPVSGATILVDGKPVSQRITDGTNTYDRNVTTDVNGKYCVVVATGQHVISVSLDGHTFTQSAFTIAGTSNVKDLDFEDNTLMQLWGRVAGGSAECDKALPSYEKSNANIGQATLYLRPTSNRGYNLNTTHADVDLGKGDEHINNTTTLQAYDPLKSADYTIAITTDAQTGEFCALVPPISYTITGGFTSSVSNDSLKAYEMPEINPVLQDNGIFTDTCIVCFQPQPVCYMCDASHIESLALGLDSVTVGQDKFALYLIYKATENSSYATDSVGYMLGHPVFRAGTSQCLYLYMSQMFYNAERNVWTQQNLPEGTEISFVSCNINADDDAKSNTVTLGNDGAATYRFTVKDPNPNDNTFVGLQASYKLNNRTYLYPDTAMQVIILGDNISEGTGVITEGPDEVDFVLHRPPGTNSSATLHSGSTIVSMSNANSTHDANYNFNNNFSVGGGVNWRWGIFKVGFRINFTEKSVYTDNISRSTGMSNFHVATISQDITTPTGALYANQSGTVFIGHANVKLIGQSYKYDFVSALPTKCLTTPLKLENDKGKVCYLVGYEGVVNRMAPDKTSGNTVGFSYTRYYIENSLIPEVKKLRNSMLLAPGTKQTDVIFADGEKVKYVSKVDESDAHYGEEKQYDRIFANGATAADKQVNEVADCNNWIKSWEQVLADDERDCINATCNNTHTISGGAAYSSSCTNESVFTTVKSTGYTFSNTESNGFVVAGDITSNPISKDPDGDSWPGFSEFVSKAYNAVKDAISGSKGGNIIIDDELSRNAAPRRKAYYSGTGSASASFDWVYTDIENYLHSDTNSKNTQTKISYTLKDSDPYDYLTIAVSDTSNASTLCYKLMGGATTNPWEGGEKTKYYNPGEELSKATMMVQKPVIKLEKSVITGVPSGHTATLDLSITNGSEINVPQYYNVALIASSNPDGLVIEMDGRPLAQGAIPVWLEAGQTVHKTLTLRQSREDVMDYEDVKIMASGRSLLSTELTNSKLCPILPFSVHFKPSCSDINLAITDLENRSINTINQKTGNTIRLKLTDYDLNYKGFQKIMLQRYDRSLQDWQTFHLWYLDTKEAMKYATDSVQGRTELYYDYDMSDFADDTYQLRAVTSGLYGTEEIPYEAPAIEIVKDVEAPRPLGNPYPISGTLTNDGEISITFNEDIYKERIVDANINVCGELNNEKLQHDTGLEFTGGDPVLSTTPITISRNGSSLDLWLRRDMGKDGTVFDHGSTLSRLAFGYDANDYFWMQVAGEKFMSEKPIKTSEWQYLHVGFSDGQLTASCMWNDDSGDHCEMIADSKKTFNYNNRAIFRFGEGFTGEIAQISAWNVARNNLEDIAASKDLPHTAGETGIQAYWPCSECHGTLAADHVADNSLSLPVESYWYIHQPNHSAYFQGGDSIVISADNIKLDNKSDYTIEMWMKSERGSTTEQGLITTSVGGLTLLDGCPALGGIKVASRDLRDNLWHHVALNVMYGKSITFLVDGKITKTVDSDTIAKYLTQHGYAANYNPDRYVIGEYFQGAIDEVRLWSSNLSHSVIRDGMYRRMSGTETGLSLLVNMEDESYFKGHEHVFQSTVSPALQPSRVPQSVRHTWTASDRKIVITPTESAPVMEGCTLYITISDIADVNGNEILNPITWNTKVNRSTLQLSNNLFKHSMIEGVESTERLTIINKGSTSDVVTISNVPSWLELSDNDFTIEPYKDKLLTLTVPEDIPIGNYSTTLLVTSQATGISESVVFDLTVSSYPPSWGVYGEQYNSNCNVVAVCKKDDNYTEDEYDEVVAYVINDDGEKIYLGNATNTYLSNIGAYRFLLNVYFDAESNADGYTGKLNMKNDRTVHFLYWDDETGQTYPDLKLYDASGKEISLTLDNMENFRVYGSPLSPYEFVTQNQIIKSLSYEKGWNWMSINTMTTTGTFIDYFPADGNLSSVKTQQSFSDYADGQWNGDLKDPGKQYFRFMYMVNAANSNIHTYQGTPIVPSKISFTVQNGWQWIPFYPNCRMPISYALRQLAMPGDIIKGQNGFSYYTEDGWVGTITNLQPDQGYMYYRELSDVSRFSYPDSYIPTYKAPRRAEESTSECEVLSDSIARAYPMNMSAILAPVCDDVAITSGTIYAYDAQGHLRGVAEIGNASSESVVFMTISGDSSAKITFVIRSVVGQDYIAKDALDYSSNALVGTPSQPRKIAFTTTDDATTDIATLRVSGSFNAYDLSGRRASESTRGVVIANGKKKVNK